MPGNPYLLLLAELIEPANLLHQLDLPPTTWTHLVTMEGEEEEEEEVEGEEEKRREV